MRSPYQNTLTSKNTENNININTKLRQTKQVASSTMRQIMSAKVRSSCEFSKGMKYSNKSIGPRGGSKKRNKENLGEQMVNIGFNMYIEHEWNSLVC